MEDIQKYELIFLEFGNISHVIKCVLHCAMPNRSISLFIYIYVSVVNPDLEVRSSGTATG